MIAKMNLRPYRFFIFNLIVRTTWSNSNQIPCIMKTTNVTV